MCTFNEELKMLSNTPVVFLRFPKYLLLILVCLYIFLKLFIIQSFVRVVAYIFGGSNSAICIFATLSKGVNCQKKEFAPFSSLPLLKGTRICSQRSRNLLLGKQIFSFKSKPPFLKGTVVQRSKQEDLNFISHN